MTEDNAIKRNRGTGTAAEIILWLLLVIMLFVSLFAGRYPITPSETLSALAAIFRGGEGVPKY